MFGILESASNPDALRFPRLEPEALDDVPALDRPLYFILLVEDNPGDVYLVRQALSTAEIDCEVSLVENGEEMLERIVQIDANGAACPDLVLLDINLPKLSGEAALRHLRESGRRCATVPIVIVTSSDSPKDRDAAFRYGANGYFRKPSDYDEFMCLGEMVRELLRTTSPK